MIPRCLYSFLNPVVRNLRNSPWIIQMVWKLEMPEKCRPHWDTVTLLMRSALRKKKKVEGPVLEIGIGEAALNSLYFFKLSANVVHGIDIADSRVASSIAVADFNKLAVRFWKSNLFEKVTDKYKLIFFNPPYVPTQTGMELDLSRALSLDGDQVWDGGVDGMLVIKEFMKSVGNYLLRDGIVLLGVQDHYIPKEKIEIVCVQNNFSIKNIHTNSLVNVLIPTTVYELMKSDK